MSKWTRLLAVVLLVCLLFTSCTSAGTPDKKSTDSEYSQEVQNLEKLCKVWGYTKYTHPAFLLGERDWDEELLKLIPVVSEAKAKKVNDILHEWFVSLGEVDYGTSRKKTLPPEDELIVQADTSWISDKKYLGKELTADLVQLDLSQKKEIPNIDRKKSPYYVTNYVSPFDPNDRRPVCFSNEKSYENMDYNDSAYCLLGLFRVWNAIEYCDPYLDVPDENWHELLPESIEKMLGESGRKNYELTLYSLTAKLKDAHVNFFDHDLNHMPSLMEEFGEYGAPVFLNTVEGKLVVSEVLDNTSRALAVFDGICPLQVGDVICKIEGKEIQDVIEHRKQYIAVPTDEKIINMLSGMLLRSHNENFEVTVLREGKEETVTVTGQTIFMPTIAYALVSHERLDGDIGLINPYVLQPSEIFSIMQEFQDTDGLILDFRQYPYGDPGSDAVSSKLAGYFIENSQPFAIRSDLLGTMPGTFKKTPLLSGGIPPGQSREGAYHYDKPVVVLINEQSQSASELSTMALRNGERVTVMGENSSGGLGGMRYLPLPGGFLMSYSGIGFYTPDGEQVECVGIYPDIEVHPTIEGIKEGLDELLEAAVAYIREQK